MDNTTTEGMPELPEPQTTLYHYQSNKDTILWHLYPSASFQEKEMTFLEF